MSYFDDVKPTYLENWGPALHRLSFASVDVPLTTNEARSLGLNIAELGETFVKLTPEQEAQRDAAYRYSTRKLQAKFMAGGDVDLGPEVLPPKVELAPADISGIRSRVDDAVAHFPKGAFVRLGSRSPKDSFLGYREGLKVAAGTDPLRFLLDASERVADDLQLALANDYAPHVWVREWVDVPAWSELRCFSRRGKLVGVSQYNYRGRFEEVGRYRDTLEWAVGVFHERHFLPACELDQVVFDVFVKVQDRGNERDAEVRLVEVNPWSPMTDPCLFGWDDPAGFDGTFRYVGHDGEVRHWG